MILTIVIVILIILLIFYYNQYKNLPNIDIDIEKYENNDNDVPDSYPIDFYYISDGFPDPDNMNYMNAIISKFAKIR
jgi:hypothetical protein